MLSHRERSLYNLLKYWVPTGPTTTSLDCNPTVDNTVADNKAEVEWPAQPLRLAWVSPFPPLHTGVAEYSKILVEGLSHYFEVIPVYPDGQPSTQSLPDGALSLSAFCCVADCFDRVIYNMGNSAFHTQIAEVIALHPGTVLLHDVFLGHCLAALEQDNPGGFAASLVEEEGLSSILSVSSAREAADRLPALNFVLRHAQHILLHSQYALSLVTDFAPWFSRENITVMPMCWRTADALPNDKTAARVRLGIAQDALLIVSLGHINPLKGHDKIIEAVARVRQSQPHVILHLVGSCADDALRASLVEQVEALGLTTVVSFTQFADADQYADYLKAADIAIQLRDESRGETSAAVMDCLSSGLATVVNDIGSFQELPTTSVLKIPMHYDSQHVAEAIETLSDGTLRRSLSRAAREYFDQVHSPQGALPVVSRIIAALPPPNVTASLAMLARAVVTSPLRVQDDDEFADLSIALADVIPEALALPRLFVDVSSIEAHDLRTGIQRVVRALTLAMAKHSDNPFHIVPVRLTPSSEGRWVLQVASQFCQSLLPESDLLWPGSTNGRAVLPIAGDTVLCLDLTGPLLVSAVNAGFYQDLQARGVKIVATVYDLLPISMPDVFPAGANTSHTQWVRAISGFDGAVCISKHVADELRRWLASHAANERLTESGRTASWTLGSDINAAQPTHGLLDDMTALDAALASPSSFLMVGTIEPRKGYDQVLEAMELLWQQGDRTPLIIVGREGWQHLPSTERQSIVAVRHTLERLSSEYPWLIWLNDASDELLDYVYARTTHVLCASYDEGFGLPIVEAMKHKKAVIARDIPVFREVGGNFVSYLSWGSPAELAQELEELLSEPNDNGAQSQENHSVTTWSESAAQLLAILSSAH